MDAAPACPPCAVPLKCNQGSDCISKSCVNGKCACPQGMVAAPIQGKGVDDCIDQAEVSNSEYNLFYMANIKTDTQDPACAWNPGWTPTGAWPNAPADAPVRYVNWCQAAAYCTHLGYRLCGHIGGGSVSQASFNDPSRDQWYNACTAEGTNAYPYGHTYASLACNGVDSVDGGSLGPGPSTSWPNCQGGEVGLLEMSGNVAEWEDSCSASSGSADTCAIRGGSYLDGAGNLRCDSNQTSLPITQPRNYAGPDVGFRCCL